MRTSFLLPALLCTAALGAAETQLLANGGFELDADHDGRPDGWPVPGASWESEGANHFMRLQATETGKQLILYRQVPANGAKAIRATFKVRYADVQRGAQPWHDARIIIDCKDAAGKALSPAPSHPYFTGSSNGWIEKSITFAVPAGTESISFMPALFQVDSGTLDIDDVALVAVDPAAPAGTATH